MKYSTKEVSNQLNITKHTLYYYEKAGLLPEIKRSSNGNRNYSESDVAWLNLICCLRDVNMPIQSIKNYLALIKNDKSTHSARKGAILSFKQKIDEDIKKYLLIQKLLNKKLDFYNEIESLKVPSEINSCYDYREDWEHFKVILKEEVKNE